KTMIIAASKGLSYDQVLNQREVVTSRLRNKNFAMLDTNEHVDVYTGHGEFISNKEIAITAGEDKIVLSSDTIIINTGAVAIKPNISGIDTATGFYNSTEIQQLSPQPNTLGIIGAGPIGLEFASLYAKLGAKVTVFNIESSILKREEPIVQELANEYLTEQGISILNDVTLNSVSNDGNKPVITANGQNYTFDAVLYATGRKPNTGNIGLENTDITTNDCGAIAVNDTCESSVPGVYAVGDVNGGPQFTYISLDDFRIVFGALTGNGQYTLKDRKNIPYTTFLTPPLARVGLTEEDAINKGYTVKTKEMLVATMPRAHVNDYLKGAFKIVVNTENNLILGATLYSQGAEELINLIKMAMDNNIPYTYFKNQIFTHPTMAENLNDLCNF
ncbi:FAD-containing oxidoreductase, partial [Veillonella sp.]